MTDTPVGSPADSLVLISALQSATTAVDALAAEDRRTVHDVARRLQDDADEVRRDAALVATAAAVDWRGPTADAFRTVLADRVHALRTAAALVGDVAEAMRTVARSS